MDRATKSELLRTIDSQQQKIAKYEGKLRDLVVAYKGIQKEKEALEASVKALSALQTPESSVKKKAKEETAETSGQFADPLNAVPTEAMGCETGEVLQTQQMREQLATLTTSLSTLAEEKSKMEATYQAEKKQIKVEHEEAVKQFTARQETLEINISELEKQLTEWRGKLRSQQHEREKEQNDHAMMLRELQKLLADERNGKEQLEQQLYDTRQSLIEHKSMPDPSEGYEKRISDLSAELDNVRAKLRTSQERASEPSPLLVQLQKEMADMKAQHRQALQQEQQRYKDTKEQLQKASRHSEERIANLEAKLSELSNVVGDYERLRYQDQQALQKLRQRVTQLDLENTALAQAAQQTTQSGVFLQVEEDADLQTIIAGVKKLQEALEAANAKAEKPLNAQELSQLLGNQLAAADDLHARYQDDYQQLKEEFERYKLRAQSVLKSKTSKEMPSKEAETLKGQVAELKERLRQLRLELEQKDSDHHKKEEALRKAMEAQKEKHKMEVTVLETEQQQKLGELEQEIRRHRDRTISLLGEKDQEIEMLRARSPERLEHQYFSTMRQMSSSSAEAESGPDGASSEDSSVMRELLARTSLTGGTPGEASLLHFAHEQARKDVEINTLRRQKHSVEGALRELQHSFSLKEENMTGEIDFLKEEVRKFERNRSRESANLEYLKNVIYRYMITRDTHGKQQMLNAISTILEFSPKEKEKVHMELLSGWWGSPAKT